MSDICFKSQIILSQNTLQNSLKLNFFKAIESF